MKGAIILILLFVFSLPLMLNMPDYFYNRMLPSNPNSPTYYQLLWLLWGLGMMGGFAWLLSEATK